MFPVLLWVCVRVIYRQTLAGCRSVEFGIGRDKSEGRKPVRYAERIDLTGRRELHGIVAAQSVSLGQRHGVIEQRLRRLDDLVVVRQVVLISTALDQSSYPPRDEMRI